MLQLNSDIIFYAPSLVIVYVVISAIPIFEIPCVFCVYNICVRNPETSSDPPLITIYRRILFLN